MSKYGMSRAVEEYGEECRTEGRAEGESIGADKLGRLMAALLSQNRIEDAKKASSDPAYRETLFKEFCIN